MSIERDGLAPRRRPRWVVWTSVVAVVGVLAGVGAALWSRRDDDPGYLGIPIAAGPQPDLRWTLDPMPAGWTAFGAAEMVQPGFSFSWSAMGSFWMSAYGTSDDPLAPTIVLGIGDELNAQGPMSTATVDMRRFESDGVVGVCGTEEFGWRRCMVTKDSLQVQSHSRGLTDDELRTALASVRSVGGAPVVAENDLPDGLSSLGSWHNQVPSTICAVHEGAVAATVGFGGTSGKVGLQVGRADEQELAFGFETRDLHARVVDGVTYYEGIYLADYLRTLVWERDGLAFEFTAVGQVDVDLVQLAQTLRPASSDEWDAAISAAATQISRSQESTTTTESAPTTSTIDAPSAASIVDVPVQVTAELLPEGGGLVVHAAAPGGGDVPFTLLETSDGFSTALGDGTFTVTGFPGGVPDQLDLVRDDRWVAGYIVTSDRRAVSLRLVRTSGERYVVDLVDVPGDPGRRMAYMVVPAGEFWSVDVIDEFGVVLDLIGKPLA